MSLPRKITPCPIQEALVEIRFEPNIPEDAVFGSVYSAVRSKYGEEQKLPILQLPEAVRRQDPNLAFKPYYKLVGESFLLQIGPRVLSVVTLGNYPGWRIFSQETLDIFSRLHDTNTINKVHRFAVRYTNFFEVDIFDKIKLQINLENESLITDETMLRTVIEEDDFKSILRISNSATREQENATQRGSVIDIDTFTANIEDNFFEQPEPLLESAHSVEKNLFFRLLSESFLQTLNPEY